jgi:hypothetical protein
MLFKFLLYAFLFYVLFRFLFGGLFKVKVYNNINHHHYPPQDKDKGKPEGTITIDKKVENKRTTGSDKIGEYVDFEEVK